MSSNMAVLALTMKVFRLTLGGRARWSSSLPKPDQLGGSSIISPYASKAATGSFFDPLETTDFLSARAVSVHSRTNVVIGAINELDNKSLFQSLSAAS